MSTDTKYQVMGELLGIMPSAIEKAEEQASRIIEMVKGEGRFAPTVKDVYWPNMAGPASDQLLEEPASVKVQPVEFTPADLSYLKDRGHTWIEIAAEAGITPDAARKRVEKWRAKQATQMTPPMFGPINGISPEMIVYEPGAEATIRKSLTIDEFIQERIAAGDMDIEILQAVKRNFPGISMNVADIRSRR